MKGLDGKTIAISDDIHKITGESKVSDLKDKLFERTGIKNSEQRLIWTIKELREDDKKLSEYGIIN